MSQQSQSSFTLNDVYPPGYHRSLSQSQQSQGSLRSVATPPRTTLAGDGRIMHESQGSLPSLAVVDDEDGMVVASQETPVIASQETPVIASQETPMDFSQEPGVGSSQQENDIASLLIGSQFSQLISPSITKMSHTPESRKRRKRDDDEESGELIANDEGEEPLVGSPRHVRTIAADATAKLLNKISKWTTPELEGTHLALQTHRGTNISCNCKNSKCIRLYCQCFAASKLCNGDCVCRDCTNTTDSGAPRMEGIIKALNMKKDAFCGPLLEDANLLLTCNCTKSRCLKKYCDCYAAGLPCTDACNCTDCLNNNDNELGSHRPKKRKRKDSGSAFSTNLTWDDYATCAMPMFSTKTSSIVAAAACSNSGDGAGACSETSIDAKVITPQVRLAAPYLGASVTFSESLRSLTSAPQIVRLAAQTINAMLFRAKKKRDLDACV